MHCDVPVCKVADIGELQFRLPTRPSARSRHTVAAHAASIRPSDAKLEAWYARHWRRHLDRVALDLDMLRAIANRDMKILEVGACPLMLSGPLVHAGYDLECVDLAPERFADAVSALSLRMYASNIETAGIPVASARYDLVLINEVFEHLRIDLIRTMQEIVRVMKPGALLLLSTPNLRSLEGLVNLLLHNKGYALSGALYNEFSKLRAHGHMGHIREYTSRDVSDFLTSTGLEVLQTVWRGDSTRFGALGKVIRFLAPPLRPFMSILARRVADVREQAKCDACGARHSGRPPARRVGNKGLS